MSLCPVETYLAPAYDLQTFADDISELAILLVPTAIGYMLWRIFVTNRMAPRGDICVLGLTETSATHSEMYGRRFPWNALALYSVITVLTFKLGVLASDNYAILIEELSTLLF